MGVPLIDIEPLCQADPDPAAVSRVAEELGRACVEHGFFYVVGHGVDGALQERLLQACREFFALPLAAKLALHMRHGGRAWRGFFPVGEELTSGRPDQKEGIYFGSEQSEDHPRVRAGLPLHGVVDECFDLSLFGDVGVAVDADAVHHRRPRLVVDIAAEDVRPFGCELLRQRASETGGDPGDNHTASFE